MQTQALDNALKEDDVALQCDPNFVGAWQSRIAILHEQQKVDDAWHCYERIIEIDPTHDGVQGAGGPGGPLPTSRKSRRKSPNAWKRRANVTCSTSRAKCPRRNSSPMPFFMANAYLSLKQPDNAITWLDRTLDCLNAAMEGQPEAMPSGSGWTILYLKLKRPDQAEKVVAWLNQVLAANGSWIDGYALREAAYDILGNTAAARADADRVAQGKPQERYSAARLFYDLDQPDKTIALLGPMIAANLPPKDEATLLMLRAAAYEMKSDYVNAKADYEHVKQIDPQFPGVQERLKAVNEKLAKPPKP